MANLLTRRSVLHGAAGAAAMGLIPFPEWFDRYGRADAAVPFVRRSVASAGGAAMLNDYRTAVATMTTKGLGDPCGWTFQWYTHQIRSDQTKATVIAGLPAAQRPLATEMWNTCQAHGGRPLQFFLPWHRMYVYFLERMVRKISGNANFALPYWNYMIAAQKPLPADFRTAPASPLFRPNRNNGGPGTANVNAGQPIDFGQPPDTINLDCMGETDYQPGLASSGFCGAINQNPHGMVHSLIGNTVGMGSVPWAANDPIFWLHHCNIDRLWASWNTTHANPGDAAWRNQQFVFADENCNRVLVTVSDFAAIGPLNYTYDTLQRVLNPWWLAQLKNIRLIAAVRWPIPGPDPDPSRIRLGAERVVLRLAPVDQKMPLARALRLTGSQRLRLKVTDLRASAQPGVLYHLYLNLPQGASLKAAQSRFIGAITFFDAVPLEGHQGHDMAKEGGPSFVFDVTDEAKAAAATEGVSITIVPAGPPAKGAEASIGNIELAVAE